MVIKKRAIISWLLNPADNTSDMSFGIPITPNAEHFNYLQHGLQCLDHVRAADWGLPEIIMPSFESIMAKSARSFIQNKTQLFHEFSTDGACGILLYSRDSSTIIYGFGDDTLYIWLFKEVNGKSLLYLYFCSELTDDGKIRINTHSSLTTDPYLFSSNTIPNELYAILVDRIILYLAVKKYAKVETTIVPIGTISNFDDTIQGYKRSIKIKNDSGQKVIVMDSRWFRKIINDNDIFVRGYLKLQPKKNKRTGLFYKELIFVDSYVRHGYHRDVKIED